jgi:phosphoribosyl 1,2-cyclic phosphodiesterase
MLRFAMLASGSAGNALIAQGAGTCVMIDCGLGPRQASDRLALLGLAPADIDAILVTHEHDDHVGGIAAFAGRHGIAVHATRGTARAAGLQDAGIDLHEIDSHQCFEIAGLGIQPMPVPHDAREPVQFVITEGSVRLGVLTDLGMPTAHVRAMLDGVSALVLECNHDPELLATGQYPGWLKRRVGGDLGHLSNAQAADLLDSIDRSRLQHLVAAHLSASNNRPALARAALQAVMGCGEDWVAVADQKTGLDWREIR